MPPDFHHPHNHPPTLPRPVTRRKIHRLEDGRAKVRYNTSCLPFLLVIIMVTMLMESMMMMVSLTLDNDDERNIDDDDQAVLLASRAVF